MSESGVTSLYQVGNAYATGDVIRERVLPTGMYEMFGGMSGRSNLETYPGG